MTRHELVDHICTYLATVLAPRAQNTVVKFMLGAASVGLGKTAIAQRVAAFCPDANATIDVNALRVSVLAGFDAAGNVPILGGLVSLTREDAEDFFTHLQSGN